MSNKNTTTLDIFMRGDWVNPQFDLRYMDSDGIECYAHSKPILKQHRWWQPVVEGRLFFVDYGHDIENSWRNSLQTYEEYLQLKNTLQQTTNQQNIQNEQR